MKKKFVVAGLFIAGLMGFAGTCTFQHISLTTVGSSKIFAGEVQNGTAANVLQHNVVVAFIGAGGTVLETQTVTPCLRSLPAGGVDFFAATSAAAGAQATAGLARVALDNTLKLGSTAAGSATFSGVTAKRAKTALTAAGGVTNTDMTTLESPVVCAVVYSAAGDVVTVGTATLANMGPGVSANFSVTVTVPDANGTADHVDLYVDGLKAGVPTAPSSDKGIPVAIALGQVDTSAKVGFTVQPPASTLYNTAMANIVVAIQDTNGVTVSFSSRTVTLAITGGTGTAGAALTCTSTLSVVAMNGLATFTGCQINKAGSNYTLTASSTNLVGAVSNTFNITPGAATQLVFTTQPGGGTGGTAWGTQPVVTVQDAGGNTVTTDSSSTVTLAIGTNAGPGGVLSCTSTLTVTVASGVATFAGCNITTSGNGYTLTAASSLGGVTGATSSTFNITVGVAAKLAFTSGTGGGTGGTAWGTQPVVKVQDAGGNTVTTDSSSTVTLAIGTNPSGGVLSCTTNPVTVSAGVAAFSGCSIDKSGNGYTLTAASSLGGVTGATSAAFNITVGVAAKLAFTTQPAGCVHAVACTTQPVVTVQDAGGNTVTSSSASITLAIGTNPSGGVLTCTTNPLAASSGVATYAGCTISLAGVGYTLTAAATGLTSATSNSFTVS